MYQLKNKSLLCGFLLFVSIISFCSVSAQSTSVNVIEVNSCDLQEPAVEGIWGCEMTLEERRGFLPEAYKSLLDYIPEPQMPFCKPGTAPKGWTLRIDSLEVSPDPSYDEELQCEPCAQQYVGKEVSFNASAPVILSDVLSHPGYCGRDYAQGVVADDIPQCDPSARSLGVIDRADVAFILDYREEDPDELTPYWSPETKSGTLPITLIYGNLTLTSMYSNIEAQSNDYILDCSQPLVFDYVPNNHNKNFAGFCNIDNARIILTPVIDDGKYDTVPRFLKSSSCESIPEDGIQALEDAVDFIQGFPELEEEEPQARSIIRKAQKMSSSQFRILKSSLKKLRKFVKKKKTRSLAKLLLPNITKSKIKRGMKTLRKMKRKGMKTRLMGKLSKLRSELKGDVDRHAVSSSSAQARVGSAQHQESISAITRAETEEHQFCKVELEGYNPVLADFLPFIVPPKDYREGDRPFSECIGAQAKLSANSCTKDKLGNVSRITLDSCVAGNGKELCDSSFFGSCKDTQREYGIYEYPVVPTDSCEVAAQDICSLMLRRAHLRSEDKSEWGCDRAKEVVEFTKNKDALATLSKDEVQEVTGCPTYPRFAGDSNKNLCVRLSRRSQYDFQKRFNDAPLGDRLGYGAGVALGMSVEMYDGTLNYFFQRENVTDVHLSDHYKPDFFGVPQQIKLSMAETCMYQDKFWATIACIGRVVQQFYDTRENRLLNNNGGQCSTECIMCRHYNHTFIQVLEEIIDKKGWQGKVKVDMQVGVNEFSLLDKEKNAKHIWPDITVLHSGREYSYYYDVTNDPGCVDLVFSRVSQPNDGLSGSPAGEREGLLILEPNLQE